MEQFKTISHHPIFEESNNNRKEKEKYSKMEEDISRLKR